MVQHRANPRLRASSSSRASAEIRSTIVLVPLTASATREGQDDGPRHPLVVHDRILAEVSRGRVAEFTIVEPFGLAVTSARRDCQAPRSRPCRYRPFRDDRPGLEGRDLAGWRRSRPRTVGQEARIERPGLAPCHSGDVCAALDTTGTIPVCFTVPHEIDQCHARVLRRSGGRALRLLPGWVGR
jgi:hypothetical protein